MENNTTVMIVCLIYFVAMVILGAVSSRRNKAASDYRDVYGSKITPPQK